MIDIQEVKNTSPPKVLLPTRAFQSKGPTALYASDRRWLGNAFQVSCVYVFLEREEHYLYRRMQMSQQRALKQQKNLLQQALVFDSRAKQLQDRY